MAEAKAQDLLFTLKQRIYIIALSIGVCSYGTEIFLSWGELRSSYFNIIAWALLLSLTIYGIIFLWLTKKISRYFEIGLYALGAAHIVYGYAAGLLSGEPYYSLTSAMWLAYVYAFAFFVFEPKRALSISLGIALPLTVIGLYSYVSRGLPLDDLQSILRIHFASSQVILFGYAAARWRESYIKKQIEAALSERLALTDALTGLMNRRALEGILELEMAKASRYQRPLTFMLFDLDHFKKINDTYGHAKGDEVLKTVAKLIASHSRLEDNLGRWGGEEFALVSSETSLNSALELAERLRNVLARHDWNMSVTASFGVAQWQPGESSKQFFERVDSALYAAKQAGRNCVKASESLALLQAQ
jgi:diguanylate cyclase (GGDEF)-like protein